MKTTFSLLGLLCVNAVALAQSISATISPNPVAAGDSVTIIITYSTANATDIIQLNLEKLDSSYNYISTVDYQDFAVTTAGSNLTVQRKVQIPSGTAPSSTLGTDFYHYKIELRDNAYNWIAGHYEALTITASTVSITENAIAGGIKVYPNPAVDVLFIDTDVNLTKSTCTLLNSLGQTVDAHVALVNNSINIAHLPKGIYTLIIGEQAPVRFIKQ